MIMSFRVEYDRDYGVCRRTGWSVVINGSFYAQLEPWLIVALVKAWRLWRLCRSEP